MREFELMVIVDGSLSEEDSAAVAGSVQSFISSKGTILKADPWGRRRLAYPIKKRSEGYYWVLSFECEPGDIDSIKYQLRINESIVRWLVTRPDRKKASTPAAVVSPAVESGTQVEPAASGTGAAE